MKKRTLPLHAKPKAKISSGASQKIKSLNLALQGGGAHGAYTWGVLDYLIEDGRIEIDGISGTSAGAMNAVVYAYGKMKKGPQGARQALEDFWQDISNTGKYASPVRGGNPFESFFGTKFQEDLTFPAFETFTRIFSPYQFNPRNYNPLREVSERHVDFSEIKACECTNLFICATNVQSGKPRIFKNTEISAEAVLASAALPFLFQAVEIDDEYFWDGGYIGNPALYPMIYGTNTRDFMIVHINPIERKEIPRDAQDIMNRINEISFNSSLVREMRAIAFVQKLIESSWLKEEHKNKLNKIRVHSIRSDKYLCDLNVASKFRSDWGFLTDLRDRGRAVAKEWLKTNFEMIGKDSTIDIYEEYLDK